MLPVAGTHDISFIDGHVKDVKALSDTLNRALCTAFPRKYQSRYAEVYVLLLCWEDDDLGVSSEINELDNVLRDVYQYKTDRWKIPSMQSHVALTRRILGAMDQVIHREDQELHHDSLLIVYYGGHGYMNEHRDCVWLCNQDLNAPTVQWSSIQTTLGQGTSDVLILLDCCAAASSAGGSSTSHTEVLGACGFESFTPSVGQHSFTRNLIEELRYYGHRSTPISTAFLYNKILARAKNSWNPRYERDGQYERRRTPVHMHLSDKSQQRCIELAPLSSLLASQGLVTQSVLSNDASTAPSTSASEDIEMSDNSESSQSLLSEVWPDIQFEFPKVLISIAVEEDQTFRPEDWIDWIKSFPAAAKCVRTEGVFKSDSTLLILSLPVAIWTQLPEDPAMSFIAFVRSHNLLSLPSTSIQSPRQEMGKTFTKADPASFRKVLDKLGMGAHGLIDRSRTWRSDPSWGYLANYKLPRRVSWRNSKSSNSSIISNDKSSINGASSLTSIGSSEDLKATEGDISANSVSQTKDRGPHGQERSTPLLSASEDHELPKQSPSFMERTDPAGEVVANMLTLASKAKQSTLKSNFTIVIHLPDGRFAERVAHLDTATDVDIISLAVVEDLGLEKQAYKGPPLVPIGGSFQRDWQVTFGWHVASRNRSYRSTFVVLDEKSGRNIDIILGSATIERMGFYQINRDVW